MLPMEGSFGFFCSVVAELTRVPVALLRLASLTFSAQTLSKKPR